MPFIDPDIVTTRTFDYIVIGAGASGSTFATRLTEDPSVSVLLLEAGEANLDDPNILLPARVGQALGNPKYDWGFMTESEAGAGGRQVPWSRGKGLGGSSGVNFLTWAIPPILDVDAFERLGNPGWNWQDFHRYIQRVEGFHPPTEVQHALGASFDPNFRGMDGPVQVSIGPHNPDVENAFRGALLNQGVKPIVDASNGDPNGFWAVGSTVDPKTNTRSYATTAYLAPNVERTNLFIITEALVAQIILAPGEGGDLSASGVKFLSKGQAFVAQANKEVILSAGAINDPKILELSGIGGKSLADIGVQQLLDLPGVGENVQEHYYTHMSFELATKAEESKEGGAPQTSLVTVAFPSLQTILPDETQDIISRLEDEVSKRAVGVAPELQEQYAIQIELLKKQGHPDCELGVMEGFYTHRSKPEEGNKYMSAFAFANHPFSRGSIHARSADPVNPPKIVANYFDFDFDMDILLHQVRFIRRLAQTEPLKSLIKREVDPGDGTEDELRKYIQDTFTTTWHTVGSCSMLPREKGGVVGPNLKVYGTKNLRIVDISVLPLHIAAHTQTMAYYIGEKAADIIKQSS